MLFLLITMDIKVTLDVQISTKTLPKNTYVKVIDFASDYSIHDQVIYTRNTQERACLHEDGDSAKLANWLAERARIPVSVSHSTVALSKALVLDCQEQIKAKP